MVVSNIISNPSRSTSIWTRVWRLGRYVWALDIGHENEKCLDAFGNGFFGTTPDQKIYEMQIAASSARRSDNPVYHQILSWPENEEIGPARFREIVQDYIEFYKLEDNQIISGLHQDTDNFHIHFVVNRFDVESGRMIQINNGFERFHAARFCCFLEDKYGYTPSENAAAYKVGDEIVLSDLYNVDSARGQIDKKSVALGSESAAQKLKRIVKWALSEAKTWDVFQDRLQAFDVTLRAGPRGGLVYCFNTGSEDEINVAAFRVSKMATRRALAKRFGADLAEPADPDTPAPEPSSSLPARVALDRRPAVPERVEYKRYSGVGIKPMATAEGQLAEVVDQLSTLFPRAHILFDQPARGAGARVHVLDRARGDNRPLTRFDLARLAPNLENLLQRGRKLRMVPSIDSVGGAQDNFALIGPAAKLSELRARGLFPAIVQDDGQKSRFIFLRVGAEDAERLRGAAVQLDCRLEKNPSLLLAANKSVVPVNVDRAHLEPPEILTRLVRPNQLQFMSEITERLTALRLMLDQLKAVASSRLTARPAWKLLNPFSRWLSTKSKGDIENARKNANPERSDSGELAPKLRSTVVRSRGVDSGTSRDAGDGERQRTDAQNVRRSDGSAQRELGIDFQSSEASRESTGGRKSSAPGSGQYSENPVAAERSRHEIRQNSETAGDFVNEPENSTQNSGAGIFRFPGKSGRLTPALRMLFCLKIAHRNGLQAGWDNETTDNIVFHRKAVGDQSSGELVARVAEFEIELRPGADRGLIEDLRSELGLPVVLPSASENLHGEAAIPDAYDPGDFGLADDVESHEITPALAPRSKPKPRFLAFDPEGLWVSEELVEGEVHIRSLDALAGYELSQLESCLFLVSNHLYLENTLHLEKFESRAQEAGLPEDIAIQVHLPVSRIEISPQVLVLVLSEEQVFEPYTAGEDHEAVVCHLSDTKIRGGMGISLSDLTDVLIHDDGIDLAANTAAQVAAAALQDRLEKWFESIGLQVPEFHFPAPDDDLDDELRRIRQGRDNDLGFSM